MRKLTAFLLLVTTSCLGAKANDRLSQAIPPPQPEGIFNSITNATFSAVQDQSVTQSQSRSKDKFLVKPSNPGAPIEMIFTRCQGLGVRRQENQWWLLPISATDAEDLATAAQHPANLQNNTAKIEVNRALWILPVDAMHQEHSWYLELHGGTANATLTATGLKVLLHTESFTLAKAEARPHSDPLGHRFSIDIAGAPELESALAGFYWGTMLPSVVEKTIAANYPYSSGYVLSTLKTSAYAGSYPAVDHEFQIKGRLAVASEADLDVVRRMIELQFKLMNDDPEKLSRAPTSVQPDGSREYHVRRNSKDNRQNAAMFPLTGNIEVIEEAWHYYESTKDRAWLTANIGNLEHAAAWTRASVDQYGRVWSDVYYEDQVIKDGRVTQAQAFAAYTFALLAKMESRLARLAMAAQYTSASSKIAAALIKPLPAGYWDEKNQRFIDWVDRDGKVHDHLHLVANTLPVTLGYATAAQAAAVRRLVDDNQAQFERFPSFLSADIAAYTPAEIGSGGPYDLSAAGRYWFWDAAYREARHQDTILLSQLEAVAAEGAKDNYFMGERYDMDYVYYIDGKNAHGAEKYYEYPNVFAAVLISKFLGLTIPADADVSVAPHLPGFGSVEFDIPEYALRFSCDASGFVLKNLSARQRRFKVDLSALGTMGMHYRLTGRSAHNKSDTKPASSVEAPLFVTLAPQEEERWLPAGHQNDKPSR